MRRLPYPTSPRAHTAPFEVVHLEWRVLRHRAVVGLARAKVGSGVLEARQGDWRWVNGLKAGKPSEPRVCRLPSLGRAVVIRGIIASGREEISHLIPSLGAGVGQRRAEITYEAGQGICRILIGIAIGPGAIGDLLVD